MSSDEGHPTDTASREDEEILAAVRALQAGTDPDAFELIYRRFQPQLFRLFCKLRFPPAEAEEHAQTTLIRAYEKIGQFRSEAKFSSWLQRIAETVWKNTVRERQTLKRGAGFRMESLDATVDMGQEEPVSLQVPDPAATPEEAALVAEGVRVVRSAVEELPPGMRICAELRLYAELKDQEISQVTGIGFGTVRSQLFEARKRLKPLLKRYFQDADF